MGENEEKHQRERERDLHQSAQVSKTIDEIVKIRNVITKIPEGWVDFLKLPFV